MKRIIKNLLHSVGVDIVRYSKPMVDKENDGCINESKQLDWIREFDIKTVIDVGANEGQFACKIRHVTPNAIIHCFEPLTKVFELLKAKFKEDKVFSFYNYGLGTEDAEKEIYVNQYSPSSSLLEMLDLHKNNFDFAVETVPEIISIRRLDSFFDKVDRPLLLKIDVQGYELHVLGGGQDVLSQADIVIIETSFYPLYLNQPLFEEIYDYFISRNFRYIGNIEQLHSPKNNKILQADAVFIRR